MFSMFDPSSSFLSLSWCIIMISMVLLMGNKMNLKVKKLFMTLITYSQTVKEATQLVSIKKKMSPNMMSKVLMMVMMMNLMAIIPFNFTPTAHLSISFTMSLIFWLSVVVFGWTNNFKNMMTHLTPMGTPNPLMNFMVLIELISMMIRPITLSIRLSANMVAGHLLMSLLSNFSMKSMNLTLMSSVAMMMLTTLELMVSVVQAYVFMTLVTLYQNENI